MSLDQRIVGDYRLFEPIGRGGMGVVYRAEHLQTGQQVALKTVIVPRAWLLQNIRREIHALARIRHPGIVRIFDHGLHEGLPWYAMELLEGRSLRQHCADLAYGSSPEGLEAPSTESVVVESSETGLTDTQCAHTDEGPNSPFAPGSSPGQAPSQSNGVPNPPFALSLGLRRVRDQREQTKGASTRPPPTSGSRAQLRSLLRMPAAGGALLPVLGVVRRLCAPLAFLHGEGIVHRDLKPANVLVRPDGMPVLVDFGVATHVGGELSRETLRIEAEATGTSHYMAPEQALRQSVDARADLYSLGCILYELVTGRPPFIGELLGEVVYQHLHAEPRPPSEVAEGVPEELDRLVLRLLAKQPRERLGHADDVAAALVELGAENSLNAAHPRARAYLYRPGFAGHARPLATLREQLGRLALGRGGIVLVGGESGAGKTRLVVELGREARSQGIEVLAGECLAVGGGPLEALRKPLQALCDRCQEHGLSEAERIFGARGPWLAPYEPAIRQLPGQEAHGALIELPAQDALMRLFRSLCEILSAAAASSGALLLLDDLQWADELVVSFLQYVARTGAFDSVRVMVLGTHRSEEPRASLQALLDHAAVARCGLGRLDNEAVASMIGDMLALVPPPKLFSRFLASQSEGSPFFVAEYLRAAVGEGLLWRDAAGRWEVAESLDSQLASRAESVEQAVSLMLPRSLRDLVSRRLKGLTADARQLTEAAAVLGRQTSLAVLRQMTGLEEAVLFSATDELLRRQVMEETGDGHLRFVHEKIREVAYESLGIERTALHRTAAEALEALSVHERREQAGDLARHWEAAGALGKAAACYLQAARAAAERYAHQEAERLFRAYLRLTADPSTERIAARVELADHVLHVVGRNAEAIPEVETALSEARGIGALTLEAKSLRLLGTLYWSAGRLEDARDADEQALSIVRGLGDRQTEGAVLSNLGLRHQDQGRLEEARQLLETALAIAQAIGDRQGEGSALNNLANLYTEQGRPEESRELYTRAVELFRQIGHLRFESMSLGNLANTHIEQGRTEEARQFLEQALKIHRYVGERRSESLVLGNLANLEAGQGRAAEAWQLYEQALAISREVGNRRLEGIHLGNLADLVRAQGRLEAAQKLYEQSLAILREIGDRRYEGIALCGLGGVYHELGRMEEARQFYERSLALHRQLGDQRFEGIVLGGLSSLELHRTGVLSRAHELATEAERLLTTVADLFELGKVVCCQGHIALASERDGREQLERAEALARAAGAGPGSPLDHAISRLRRAVAEHAAGRGRLFRGHVLETLPAGLRRWLRQD